jgi:signal transduction histidine kinase
MTDPGGNNAVSADRHRKRWAIILAAIILTTGFVCARSAVRYTDRRMRDDLLAEACRVASSLRVERMRGLTGTEADVDSPVYQRIKKQLLLIRPAYPMCRFLYLTGVRDDGSVVFLADSEPPDSEDYSPPGQSYPEASEMLLNAFTSGAAFTEGPIADRWGVWVSGMVPIADPGTGEPLAILGMDVDASAWKGTLVRSTFPSLLLTVILGAILSLGLALLRRSRRAAPDGSLTRIRIEPALTLAAGLAFTVFAAWASHERATHDRLAEFAVLMDSESARLAEAVYRIREFEMVGLARLYEASQNVTEDEFAHYAAPLTDDPAVRAWRWVPVVPAGERALFEGTARAGNPRGVAVWQPGPKGERLPAEKREVYHPVAYTASRDPDQACLGLDEGASPLHRAAIEEAARTRLPTAGDPVLSAPADGRARPEWEMTVFLPVYGAQDPARPRGFVSAVLQLNALLRPWQGKAGAHLGLSLLRDNGVFEPLAPSTHAARETAGVFSSARPIALCGRVLWMTAHAEPEFAIHQPRRAAAWAALTGLILTVALAILVDAPLRRRDELERLVAHRTRALEQELHERKIAESDRESLRDQLLQSQKLESLGVLAGGVAHEINNPINGVMNYAQLIKDKIEQRDPVLSEYAGEIIRETDRVAGIVRNLLAFARQGKQEHSPARPCDIAEGTIVLVRTILRHDRIVLTVDVPEDLPEVQCRSQQIQQVLMNLITNARDALNEKYPEHDENKKIAVTALAFEKDGETWVRITVEDTGPGIPPEARRRIFDPFFTTKPRRQGTGLGLSISHGIVKDHRGELRVESEVGAWTRFHVELPAYVA